MTPGSIRNSSRGVLVHHRPADDAEFVLWPVLVYRVTAPVQAVRRIDIFEKIMLALCEAGVRRDDDLAAHTGLDVDLCRHIVLRQIDAGRLTRERSVTTNGRDAHRRGMLAENPELIVTHVFQDAFDGGLFPRSAIDLRFEPVESSHDASLRLRLGRRGAQRFVTGTIVECTNPIGWAPPPDVIITAIARHRMAIAKRRQSQAAESSPAFFDVHGEEDIPAEERFAFLPEVHRVVEVGEPRRELLLCSLDTSGSPELGGDPPDPFGLGTSPLLRRLMRTRSTVDRRFADRLSAIRELEGQHKQERLRNATREWAEHVEQDLAYRLGEALFTHQDTAELLKGVYQRAGEPDSAQAAENVRAGAFRMYEHLLRRLIHHLPPPRNWSGRPPRRPNPPTAAQMKADRDQAWEVVEKLATNVGFNQLPAQNYKSALTSSLDRGWARVKENTRVWEMLCWSIVSAADPTSPHRGSHPLLDLAERCPQLPTDLVPLGTRRNSSSHGPRDQGAVGTTEWSLHLATEGARTALLLPPENS